jgi:hypothetical protein
MMRPGRSAFLIGSLALVLGLSPLLGCAVAPLDPDTDAEIAEAEAELDANASDEDPAEDPGEDDLQPGPDPIPWKPSSFTGNTGVGMSPGEAVLGPDPIPWRPVRDDSDTDSQTDRSASAP